MDGLILTFTPEQLKKYNEIKERSDPLPEFDARFDYTDEVGVDIASVLGEIAEESRAILSYRKKEQFFNTEMAPAELEKFKASYFKMINGIEALRKVLYAEISKVSRDILLLDKKCASLSREYSEFLPYKAALYGRCEHREELERTDGEFISSLESARGYISKKKERLDTLILICDTVIPDFYRGISAHSDSPRFESFDSTFFFNAVTAFIYQIEAIQKQKPM